MGTGPGPAVRVPGLGDPGGPGPGHARARGPGPRLESALPTAKKLHHLQQALISHSEVFLIHSATMLGTRWHAHARAERCIEVRSMAQLCPWLKRYGDTQQSVKKQRSEKEMAGGPTGQRENDRK